MVPLQETPWESHDHLESSVLTGSLKGHLHFALASSSSTQRYVEADLAMKEKALARLVPPDTSVRKFRVPDSFMRFLQTF